MSLIPGQVYRSCDPRESIRLRVVRHEAGWNRVDVVDATTGRRPRRILASTLHESATTKTGRPRRTGYVLEAATPATATDGVQ
jgi:hypothetical protein